MRSALKAAQISGKLVCVVAFLLASVVASGDVGDIRAVITVPSGSSVGVGIAVDCQDPANLYYTNSYDPTIYKMDASGNNLGSVAIADAVTGAPISFGAIAWDKRRNLLWGGTDDSGSPISVYQIDPLTGLAKYQYTAVTPWIGFCDGIDYDPSDDTIYVSDNVSSVIEQHSASAGAWIRTFTPTNAAGSPLGLICGLLIGEGDLLYLGRNGQGNIVKVKKSDGSFIAAFASPGGRVEDLACDALSFAPATVIWSKDAYDDTVIATEVESGACGCSGEAAAIPTFTETGMIVLTLALLAGIGIKFGRRATST